MEINFMIPNNQNINLVALKHKQQGAVLMVSILILLVLTIIGVSSLNGSLMEEKMAANAQLSTTIFQTAESAIRETYFEENVDPSASVTHAEKARKSNTKTRGTGVTAITRETQMLHTGRAPLYNSSEGLFASHGIEIIGTANKGYITEKNGQGYSVHPLRPF